MEKNYNPRFIPAKIVREIFGLSIQRLTDLCAQGAIRTVKLGESKQAGRLFNVDDIEQALLRLSAGKNLKKKTGYFHIQAPNPISNSGGK